MEAHKLIMAIVVAGALGACAEQSREALAPDGDQPEEVLIAQNDAAKRQFESLIGEVDRYVVYDGHGNWSIAKTRF